MEILVDTDIIIDYLRSRSKKDTLFDRLFVDTGNIAVLSFVTVIELFAGADMLHQKKRKLIEEIIQKSLVVESDRSFTHQAGELLRKYKGDFQDGLIAAHALLLDLPLLTKNKKDFKKIKDIRFYD